MSANKKGEAAGIDFKGYDKLIEKSLQNSIDRMKEISEKLSK